MQETHKITFREIALLENSRLENKLRDSFPRKNKLPSKNPPEFSLPVIIVMVVAILLMIIGGVILLTIGAMAGLSPI